MSSCHGTIAIINQSLVISFQSALLTVTRLLGLQSLGDLSHVIAMTD